MSIDCGMPFVHTCKRSLNEDVVDVMEALNGDGMAVHYDVDGSGGAGESVVTAVVADGEVP